MSDYIKREDVIEVFEKYSTEDDKLFLEIVRALVNSIPSADVAPMVHGKWISCFEDWRKQIEGDKCTACGFEHYGTNIKNYNYCPNCGAKMDLEE